jgi:hypothetical protein
LTAACRQSVERMPILIREELLKQIPARRIKPFDGMSVTAAVWEEAHEYHRQQQRFHHLLNHGAGILAGLEVIASDPPDNSVYILPGIACDSSGQTIVLPEPLSFDLGAAQGLVYLLLSYGEGKPRPEGGGESDNTLYIHAQYGLEAGPTLPQTAYVEVARVRRQGRGAPIRDAPDRLSPQPNEIDLRFRRDIGTKAADVASIAVCYLGDSADKRHGRGVRFLANALRRSGDLAVCVDDQVPLAAGADLSGYTLVYLVGQGAFQLGPDEMNVLYAYLQGNGTLLFESCRRDAPPGDPPADAAFLDVLSSFGVQLNDLPSDHRLLAEPWLFAAPPPGFETEGAPIIKLSDGVILTNCDYGCLWQGERRGRAATREEIRTAMEWGRNLVAYALERRKQANK